MVEITTANYDAEVTNSDIPVVLKFWAEWCGFCKQITPAVEELAREGYDPKYGARPLRRCLQEKLEDAVAEQLLDGTLHSGDTARLTLEGDRLLVTK